MRRINFNAWLVMSVFLLATAGTSAQAVVIDWVTVGDPCNTADTEVMNDGTTGYGSVSYVYRIGKYEVTNSQYCEFLNAVARTDTYGLYNPNMAGGVWGSGGIARGGSPGTYTYSVRPGRGNNPVNYVSWYDSLRFANWLHNGQPSGGQNSSTTEDGAYTFSGAESVSERNAVAQVFISCEDEWYKVAYYKGGGADAGYWDYATQSDTPPTLEAPPGGNNSANAGSIPAGGHGLTDVGAYVNSVSAYGTFDQNGNLHEWNETRFGPVQWCLRGGAWDINPIVMAAHHRDRNNPAYLESWNFGFRVASFPKPTTIYYVDVDAAGINNGSSWDNAFNDLQDALAVAESSDEIRVAQGTYSPQGPLPDIRRASNPNPMDRSFGVSINADLSWTAGADAISHDVYFGTTSPGMFQGNQTATTFDPGTMAYGTTYYWCIDEVRDDGKTTGTVWSFATMMSPPPPPLGGSNEDESIEPAVDRTATFQLKNGVVIKGGYAGFGEPDPNARDIKLYETILSGDIVGDDESDFVNYEENSYHVVTGSGCDETAVLDGFTITAGNADGSHPNNYGAGMYNYKGSPMLINCIFSRNSATWGGGMQNSNSSPTLNNCTFSNNSAVNRGGGIFNLDNSSPTLINCTFFGNSADLGGGMQNWDSSPILTSSIFSGNLADDRGGGMENIRSNLTLTNCTFTGNSVRGYGCGVFNLHSSSTFTNCTFSRNTARRSGGIYNYDSGSTLTNCILWENAGNIDALQITLEGDSTMSVKYCDIHYGQETIYVMDSTLEWGEGNISTNPLFANLVGGDCHLLPVSPCINTGDPDYIAEPNETDLDGKPRIIAGRIDMGAYEFNHIPVADAGPNQTVEAQAPWGATVTLDGSGSSDADCTPGTYDDINDFNWYLLDPCDPNADVLLGSGVIIDCNLSIGEHIIILEVIDRAGASDTNEVTIVVQDTTPPDINCPTDVMLQCPADTSVEANGSATTGDTCGSVAIAHSDQWQPGCGNTGTLVRTWTSTDECGNSSSCVQTIKVVDTTPPEFEFSVSPTMFWPPNHKMVEITPSWTVSDECDATPDVSLVSIVANEEDDIIGDGHMSNDIQIDDDGSIFVRSERSGTDTGRIYTITYQAVDDCGNTTVRSAAVSIPHEFKLLARIGERWLRRNYTGNLPEDLNGDGIVNLKDIAIFANNWIQ